MRDEAKANEHFVFDLFVIAFDLKWALKYSGNTLSESSFFCITFPASLMRLSRESWVFFKKKYRKMYRLQMVKVLETPTT